MRNRCNWGRILLKLIILPNSMGDKTVNLHGWWKAKNRERETERNRYNCKCTNENDLFQKRKNDKAEQKMIEFVFCLEKICGSSFADEEYLRSMKFYYWMYSSSPNSNWSRLIEYLDIRWCTSNRKKEKGKRRVKRLCSCESLDSNEICCLVYPKTAA